ncbi:unnamed protein product [Eruca vesicaria subsp. sativa]|uniref:ATP phosphoribosyltransferase n=1 Tax=Eruca vesicaria subsp. sativa TaxID=29727 RepID=A0ABC8M7T7_ERUVS|nr:unnamed protein product [Eruca vesicaria subsp. sativa]
MASSDAVLAKSLSTWYICPASVMASDQKTEKDVSADSTTSLLSEERKKESLNSRVNSWESTPPRFEIIIIEICVCTLRKCLTSLDSLLNNTAIQRSPPPSSSIFSPIHTTTTVTVTGIRKRCLLWMVTSCVSHSQSSVQNGFTEAVSVRNQIRLGLPSKGRMATDTLDLPKDCQLSIKTSQSAAIRCSDSSGTNLFLFLVQQLPNTEVWFQRPKDIVRKLLSGDLDLGIVGLDLVSEFGQGNDDLIIVHEALNFGDCHLSLAIPNYGIFENINSLKELAQMPQWTEERPLRVATGFNYLGPKFMKENGIKHVTFSTADGALEAAPAVRFLLYMHIILRVRLMPIPGRHPLLGTPEQGPLMSSCTRPRRCSWDLNGDVFVLKPVALDFDQFTPEICRDL